MLLVGVVELVSVGVEYKLHVSGYGYTGGLYYMYHIRLYVVSSDGDPDPGPKTKVRRLRNDVVRLSDLNRVGAFSFL